jgi:hypothetical protein
LPEDLRTDFRSFIALKDLGGKRINVAIEEEGLHSILSLYASLGPLWARQIPYTIIKFVAFEKIATQIYLNLPKPKEKMNKLEQLGVVLGAGYMAGNLFSGYPQCLNSPKEFCVEQFLTRLTRWFPRSTS